MSLLGEVPVMSPLLQNPLLEGGDLSTMIGVGTGDASFDANGRPLYKNRRQVNSTDRTLLRGFREISQMADRLNLTKSTSVS